MKLAFIGGGNMAKALLAGLENQRFQMPNITVVERDNNKRAALEETFGITTTTDLTALNTCETIILAIKPQQLSALAQSLAPILNQQLVISIAAGVLIQDLSRWLNNYQMIIRAMPNTPAQIQAGITGLYAMPKVSAKQKLTADQIMRAAGETVWLETETQLDAVTAISGSGPAYVFYLIEALQAAAQQLGLSEEEAKKLSIATFKGASLLADASNSTVAALREQVTSKGGTTEQGLIGLQEAEVNNAIAHAAEKAYNRAKTLAKELGEAS